ncbi:uncharacterized protein LOC111304919 isoform X3 [Durio zibethinus]|uniref:Uncharacterized protein LOC111304919 isoform X3 n=1 Tax=Durio zibethinus TaxID=66656 RepID=A0A6P5ZZ03_DURZI|nr:uncharacterized protein LOC111304919 isoform X3 [Durio zibethinus]XP_022757738.1 uncharacterized protein LOC111304919 isoform X3 [Durio zibethinus]
MGNVVKASWNVFMAIEDVESCVNETAKKLSKWLEVCLCEAYAQVLCYGTGTVWVQEPDIWNDLDRHELRQSIGPDNATYVYTKRRVMEAIVKLLETRTNSHGIREFKCPDSVSEYYKPFTCRIRQLISKHALIIAPVCTGL